MINLPGNNNAIAGIGTSVSGDASFAVELQKAMLSAIAGLGDSVGAAQGAGPSGAALRSPYGEMKPVVDFDQFSISAQQSNPSASFPKIEYDLSKLGIDIGVTGDASQRGSVRVYDGAIGARAPESDVSSAANVDRLSSSDRAFSDRAMGKGSKTVTGEKRSVEYRTTNFTVTNSQSGATTRITHVVKVEMEEFFAMSRDN